MRPSSHRWARTLTKRPWTSWTRPALTSGYIRSQPASADQGIGTICEVLLGAARWLNLAWIPDTWTGGWA